MPRQTSPKDLMQSFVLLSISGNAGEYQNVNFIDGSYTYLGYKLQNAFEYILLDNIGSGLVRFTYNRPDYNITTSVDGSKSLKSLDTIYFDEEIWHVRIYFEEASTVEILCKSLKDQNE